MLRTESNEHLRWSLQVRSFKTFLTYIKIKGDFFGNRPYFIASLNETPYLCTR